MRLCGNQLFDHGIAVKQRLPTWHRLAPRVTAPLNNPAALMITALRFPRQRRASPSNPPYVVFGKRFGSATVKHLNRENRDPAAKSFTVPSLGTKVTPRYCSPKHWRNIMISKRLAIAFLAIASMLGAAAAQTATNQGASATATTHKEGEWRASKLAGVDVYNEANEKIGDIHDVILDRSGKVANVILAVGGVLGLGDGLTSR
jgi:hypothetical protein